MAWKETGFSLCWSIVSSSSGPLGAGWEGQLDQAQHPGGLGSHPRPWMDAPLALCRQHILTHPGSATAGPGQPKKIPFLS